MFFYFMMVTFILPLHFKLVGLNRINGNLISLPVQID
jgi:hypothetical protein